MILSILNFCAHDPFAIVDLLDHYFHKLGTISDGPLNETPLAYIGVVNLFAHAQLQHCTIGSALPPLFVNWLMETGMYSCIHVCQTVSFPLFLFLCILASFIELESFALGCPRSIP